MAYLIPVLFKEVPEGTHFKENHYTKLPVKKAYQYIADGVAVGYDIEAREETNPILSEDFPSREILLENGIYTEAILEVSLPVLQDIPGIGEKKAEEIKSALEG